MGQAGRGDGIKRAVKRGRSPEAKREARTKRGRSAALSANEIRNGRQTTLAGAFDRLRSQTAVQRPALVGSSRTSTQGEGTGTGDARSNATGTRTPSRTCRRSFGGAVETSGLFSSNVQTTSCELGDGYGESIRMGPAFGDGRGDRSSFADEGASL